MDETLVDRCHFYCVVLIFASEGRLNVKSSVSIKYAPVALLKVLDPSVKQQVYSVYWCSILLYSVMISSDGADLYFE